MEDALRNRLCTSPGCTTCGAMEFRTGVRAGLASKNREGSLQNNRTLVRIMETFKGFPYLVTRVSPAIYDITLYPGNVPEARLVELASAQASATHLSCCLVLTNFRGLWLDPAGTETWSQMIPSGGCIINGRLKASEDFPQDADMRHRQERLERLAEFSEESLKNEEGYLVGDPVNCVREATPKDRKRLGSVTGTGEQPAGISTCPICGEWRGECFYPDFAYPDAVWKLTCRCENDNRCARYGQPLHDHKLDACYYDPETRSIFHVAGYMALAHNCPD